MSHTVQMLTDGSYVVGYEEWHPTHLKYYYNRHNIQPALTNYKHHQLRVVVVKPEMK